MPPGPRRDRLGTALVVIALIALGLAILTTATRLMGFRLLGLLFLAPASAVVGFIDAFRARQSGGRPLLVALGMFFLWIVTYPWWMFRRASVVAGARPRGWLGLVLAVAIGAFSVGLVERVLGMEPIAWSTGDGDDWDD